MTTAPKPTFYDMTPPPDPYLTFGRHKGLRLSQAPRDYLNWLAKPKSATGQDYQLPPGVQAATHARIALDDAAYAEFRTSGQVAPGDETTVFVVTAHGDKENKSAHRTLADALAAIRVGAPCEPSKDGSRSVPDPEDDRLLVWEVLPTGHSKVVWHFSGWHWPQDEFGLPQGTLPGDDRSLYEIAMSDEGGFE